MLDSVVLNKLVDFESNNFEQNQAALQTAFVCSPILQIVSISEFWEYISTVAPPVLYPSDAYIRTAPSITNLTVNLTTANRSVNGVEQTSSESARLYSLAIPSEFIASDGSGFLLGSTLRQWRVLRTQCSLPQYLLQYFSRCSPFYSERAQDTSSSFWTNSTLSPFQYTHSYATETNNETATIPMILLTCTLQSNTNLI